MLKLQKAVSLTSKHQGFPYQVEAVEAVKGMEYAAIFHEQGLGKTKIGLDLALHWLNEKTVDSILIITKKSLIQNWREEIAAHSFLTPRIISQDKKANFFAFNSPARVYLAHYEVVRSELKRLKLFQKTRRIGVLLDESHKIKNPESVLTQAFYSLSSGFTRRVIMTGTPVANRPFDLWSQIRFLDQGASLGDDFISFRRSLDLGNDLARNTARAAEFEDALEKVFSSIRPFSVRQTKLSAGISLPDKHIQNILVELEERQYEIYTQFRDEMAAIGVKDGQPTEDNAEEILKRLLRLVQVSSNPAMLDESYTMEPGKLPILMDLIHQAVDVGEKVIVWTSFTKNADWLTKQLAEFSPVRVHGKMAITDRNAAIASFKTEEDCKILIATPGAAKEGLTLTMANHTVFFDRSFSLDDYLQAQDRIHRISQDKPCYVYNLIARDTVDEWVDTLLAAKHLAAQLGQGDISREGYAKKANYEFGEMIRSVLNLDNNGEAKHE